MERGKRTFKRAFDEFVESTTGKRKTVRMRMQTGLARLMNKNCTVDEDTFDALYDVWESIRKAKVQAVYREPFDEINERLHLNRNGERLEKSAFHVPTDWQSMSDEKLILHLRQRGAIKPLLKRSAIHTPIQITVDTPINARRVVGRKSEREGVDTLDDLFQGADNIDDYDE